jgi:hypothetical protein
MAKQLTQLTIFISGTSETDSEKAALRRVIEEINRQLEKTHSLTLRVLGWPDDVRPGANADLQTEVNRQIGSKYDIYVGLLATKFGTPTPRAGSGTEEEFESAMAAFNRDSQMVRVLFYFKRTVEDPYSIDVQQLEKVKQFREGLSRRGVLYSDFKDTEEFVKQTKEHLYNLIIDEWRENTWIKVTTSSPIESLKAATQAETKVEVINAETTVQTTKPPSILALEAQNETLTFNDEDELGLLDYMVAFHAATGSTTEALELISKHTEQMNEQLRLRTAETELLLQEFERHKHIGGSRVQQEYVEKARNIVDRAASHLEEFVNAMIPDIEQYRISSREMFTNLQRGIDEGGVLNSEGDENQQALVKLIEAMETGRAPLSTLQTTIRQMPALTGRFKRARKRTALVLGDLIAETSFSIEEARTLLSRFKSNDN